MTLRHLGGHTNGALIDVAQSQKATTSNTLDNLLADATQQAITIGVVDDGGSPTTADFVLSTDQYTGNFLIDLIEDSPGPTVAFTMTVDNTARFFLVRNGTNQTCTVDMGTSPSDTVVILSQQMTAIINTGDELIDILTFNAGPQTIYDVGFYFPGTPISSELMWQFVASRDFQMQSDFQDSEGFILTNPTSSFVMDVDKNGSALGTITVSTGGAFTFAMSGSPTEALDFVSGDRISVTGPAVADATAASISVTFRGLRQ